MLDSLILFVPEKRAFCQLQDSQSVFKGILSKVCCRSTSLVSHNIFGLQKLATDKKTISLLPNLRSISFIAKWFLFLITQY